MIPIKKILCPTDFSEPSYVGLDAADEIASHFSSKLILVHVVPPAYQAPGPGLSGFDVTAYMQEINIHAQKFLDELVKTRIDPGVNVLTLIRQGSPADQIVHVAEKQRVGLIVTATHGWSGLKRVIFGSVAEKVVRHSPCPVLTVPGLEEEAED